MFDLDNVRNKLYEIISNPDFDCDFGGPVANRDLILSDIDKDEKSEFPLDYIIFIQSFGTGQLGYTFFIDPGPIPHEAIFGKNVRSLEGLYIFGSDLAEYVFAFDSKNEWQVVEIDSESRSVSKVANNFSEFIEAKLADILS